MPKVRIRVGINRQLRTLQQAFVLSNADRRSLLSQMDAKFRSNMRSLYNTEGTSGGQRWSPLKPKYLAWKKRQFSRNRNLRKVGRALRAPSRMLPRALSLKILQLTTEQKRSLTEVSHPQHIRESAGAHPRYQFTLGTENETAYDHSVGRADMDIRDPIQQTEDQKDEYLVIAYDYAIKKVESVIADLRKAGFRWI